MRSIRNFPKSARFLLGFSGWFSLPIPFYFGLEFHFDAIIMMILMYVVQAVQTIGVGIESKPEILQFLPQLAQNILGSSLMVSFLVAFLLNILVSNDEEEVKTRLAL